jgi:hypothetical protein
LGNPTIPICIEKIYQRKGILASLYHSSHPLL